MVTFEERLEIARILERGHSLFRQFWDIGAPQLVEYRDTACIVFDPQGNQVGFQWNPDFWESLDVYNRAFVAGHEMLHVILDHGHRMLSHKDDQNSNIAMDIVVNHLLVDYFGFDRDKLDGWENKCWVDTVFAHDKQPAKNKSYEYYYNLLEEMPTGSGGKDKSNMPGLVDEHGIMSEGSICKVGDELSNYIIPGDLKTLQTILDQHGNTSGSWVSVVRGKQIPKKKWEKVIPPNTKKRKYDFDDFDTWVRDNKRLADMIDNDDVFLQTSAYMEDYYYENNMRSVWFFLDFSGSCVQYLERFLKAADTLSKKKFEVKLFTFDIDAREAPKDFSNVRGGGGTCFQSMETLISEYEKYPDNIFVITDGDSAPMKAKHPERWHWFLSKKGNIKAIPRGGHIYHLDDFE